MELNTVFQERLKSIAIILSSYGIFGPTANDSQYREDEIAGFIADVENNTTSLYTTIELTYRESGVRLHVTTSTQDEFSTILGIYATVHPAENPRMNYEALNADFDFIFLPESEMEGEQR